MGFFNEIFDDLTESISDKVTDFGGDIIDSVGDKITDVADNLTGHRISRAKDRLNAEIQEAEKQVLSEAENIEEMTFTVSRKPNNNQSPKKVIGNGSRKKEAKGQSSKHISTVEKLQKEFDKLDREQERKTKEIGTNIFASIADEIFGSRYKKTHQFSRMITGKSKEEKIEEIINAIDDKRAKFVQNLFLPTDPKDLWELLLFIHSIDFKDYTPKSAEALKNFYLRAIDHGSRVFPISPVYYQLFLNYTPLDFGSIVIRPKANSGGNCAE